MAVAVWLLAVLSAAWFICSSTTPPPAYFPFPHNKVHNFINTLELERDPLDSIGFSPSCSSYFFPLHTLQNFLCFYVPFFTNPLLSCPENPHLPYFFIMNTADWVNAHLCSCSCIFRTLTRMEWRLVGWTTLFKRNFLLYRALVSVIIIMKKVSHRVCFYMKRVPLLLYSSLSFLASPSREKSDFKWSTHAEIITK